MEGTETPTFTEGCSSVRDPLPEVGDAFGDYELLGERGRGGMGAVYRARNQSLGRIVALKVLLPHRRHSPEAQSRLRREAHALAQLDHHNIVVVHHIGLQGSLEFIEMQYVEGESLVERLKRGPPLDVAEAVRIVEQVAHALSHAHRRGIVHRDIKPGNVLLTPEGVAKVVDFGLARSFTLVSSEASGKGDTPSGTVCGTPHFMAPEAWAGRPPDPRSDQYCLGVTLYCLLTGRTPFSGDTVEQMRQHLFDSPTPPHHLDPRIPRAVSRIVARLMEKDPSNRYPSCDELVTDLRLALRPEQGPAGDARTEPGAEAQADRPVSRLIEPGRSRPLLAGSAVALLVLALNHAGAFDAIELRTLDARFAWTPGAGGQSPLVLVVADPETKKRLAPDRPLSRERHYGELIARLAQASAIGMDLLFTDRAASEEDGGLAAVTGLSPRVVHAVNVALDGGSSGTEDSPASWTLDVPADRLLRASRVEIPVPEISAATGRVGHLALSVDPDGTVRRVPHLVNVNGRVYPSLSLAVAMASLGVERSGVRLGDGFIELRRSDGAVVRIPVDEHAQMLVNFRWAGRAIDERPLWQVLETPPHEFAGRVVIVGSGLDGERDLGALPARAVSPMMWAHALAVDTILSGSFVVPAPSALCLGLVVGLALAAAVAGGTWSAPWGMGASLGGLLGYWALGFIVFAGQSRLWLPLVAPSAALVGGYLASAFARYRGQEREKRMLASALSRYLSPAVTRRVLSDPEAQRLGGKRKELTVLSGEVLHFGEAAEALEPEEVQEFLHAFFDAMTEVAFRHEGTLDQLSGQGLRAFFGDPEPQEDHALRAIHCALEMRARFSEVVRAWARRGRPSLQVGIGIATGYVTVGNVGSPRRMQYTALGRSVDQAATLARVEPGRILVSPRTRALAEEGVSFDPRPSPEGGSAYFEVLALR